MYIINNNDEKMDHVIILLRENELRQLIGCAKQLIETKKTADHYHLSTDDYNTELTIGFYDPLDTKSLHPSIRKLIQEDSE